MRWSLRPGPRTRALVIVFSAKRKFEMGGQDFGATTLDLSDRRDAYYAVRTLALTRALRDFITDNDFQSVCCLGYSKGGFGSLAVSRALAQAMPERTFSAFAFSPQTQLWPPSRRLRYPTYKAFLEGVKSLSATERRRTETLGDQTKPANLPNLRWLVTYGARNPVDSGEALALRGSSVVLDPLPVSFHVSLLFYLVQGLDREGVTAYFQSIRRSAPSSDEDAAFTQLSEKAERTIDEIMAIPPRRTLPEIVGWLLKGEWRGASDRAQAA
ncbi:hypothetical protein ACFSCV_14725 [Methylopila henanensis]|uniref:Uncharacterized protein n=1 Tax=Methylopila henanensis TaxID=873516 RepID=A0ABW4KB21_9HYPH